jgi:outer membrane receptor protein involved in Fe transport
MTRPRMRRRLGVVTVIVACALFVFGESLAGTTGGISGIVRDAKTGEPIALATVTVPELRRGATTDAQGAYFIVNLPAGKYTVRVALLGYVPQAHEGIEVFPDFTAKLDFSMEPTVLKDVAEVDVKAERPLIQKDATGTTKFLSSEEIKNLPLRGYQDAVAQQSGVVNFKLNIDNEAQNNNTLIIRGGRPNEVAYYVDGFSQQDPLTGVSTTAINADAIDEVVVHAGGFNAEYGRINSGVVNVVTREGSGRYFGSLEGIFGDWVDQPDDSKILGVALGGPVIPKSEKVTFYLSGERRDVFDRRPSTITDEVADPSQPGLFANGVLPSNASETWSGLGKLAWKPSSLQTLRFGGTYNQDEWQQYLNVYRFNLAHAPRYRDRNWSAYGTWNHSLNERTFYEVKANIFTTDRIRGDGRYFDDLKGYARASNPSFSNYYTLFWNGDNPSTAGVDEGHVWEDFLHRNSSYWGIAANYASQISNSVQLKMGGDFQRHSLRYYNHYFPTRLYDAAGAPSNISDVERYGYDVFGNEVDGGDTFTDSDGDGNYDAGEPFNDANGNGVYDEPLDGPKHPKVASFYAQSQIKRLDLVVNAGLRWDYLTPSTQALRSERYPLDPDSSSDQELQASDLEPSKVYHRLSPRLGVGFPVSDQTLVHLNYGKFFQQPNLQDLYASYAFLEHKIRVGGYFVGFGNPNLKPELTTAYELGIAHTPTERSRVQVTAYYKDVKDLVEITTIRSSPNAFTSYRNRDFATIKGLDLGYTLRQSSHLAMNASYSLSWAFGTGSVSQTQRNIAWGGGETPKQTSPLSYDQRHKLSADFDYRFGRGEGPEWGGKRWLQNMGINLLVNAASGTPYTPTVTYNEVTLQAVDTTPTGPINSRYGPWTITADLKVNRAIPLGPMSLDLYVWVLNLLNRDNPRTVYTSSGSARTTNFLNTEEGQNTIAQNGPDFVRLYRLATLDPNFFDYPRQVRVGAKMSF